METPPKVIPVRDPEEQYLNKSGMAPIHKHLPQIDGFGGGACVLLVSPVKTGKSTLISNMLLNSDFYDAQERFDSTHVISNTIANDVTSRFLKEAFDCHDQYNDAIIDGLVERQKTFKKEDQPEIAVIIDDCLGSIKREGRVNHLASRFRHFNIKLLIISSQNFRAVSPIIRQNATNVIIGSPFPNRKELLKVADEYGDLFGGSERFIALYKKATPDRYNFIHLDLQDNPPVMYRNFDEVMAVGDKPTESLKEENIDEMLKKENIEENVDEI